MAQVAILVDGEITVGVVVQGAATEGETVTVELHNENGMPIKAAGVVVEVFGGLMTPDNFRAWHHAMGYTYDTGAAALGVSRGTYADWLAGRSRTTGQPIKISKLVALACAAIAAGLDKPPSN